MSEKRTIQQNKSLHKWCEMIAEEYNNAGLDIETVVKNYTMDLFWTKEAVKEVLIRHIIRNMFKKESTTEIMKTGELDKLIDVITKFNAKMGIGYIPFPSEEKLENN